MPPRRAPTPICNWPCCFACLARILLHAHNVQRNALHQAFRIDVSVEECRAPGLKRRNHFQRSDRGQFAPAANGDPSLLGIDGEDQLIRPENAARIFRKCQVGLAFTDQRRSRESLASAPSASNFSAVRTERIPPPTWQGRRLSKLTDEFPIVAGTDGSIQIDQLNHGERRETRDPFFEVIELQRLLLALHEAGRSCRP